MGGWPIFYRLRHTYAGQLNSFTHLRALLVTRYFGPSQPASLIGGSVRRTCSVTQVSHTHTGPSRGAVLHKCHTHRPQPRCSVTLVSHTQGPGAVQCYIGVTHTHTQALPRCSVTQTFHTASNFSHMQRVNERTF
jgi:hypothetical protein